MAPMPGDSVWCYKQSRGRAALQVVQLGCATRDLGSVSLLLLPKMGASRGRLFSHWFQVQTACQSHLPPSQAGRREEKRRNGKGKETQGGRKGRNKCFLFRPAEPSQKSLYTCCISLVRTVSRGHINFPRSLLHTSPRIPLVRTV